MNFQFSLRFLLAAVLAWAVAIALTIQFPHQAIFVAAIAMMMLVPLTASAFIFQVLRFDRPATNSEPRGEPTPSPAIAPGILRATGRFFGLWPEAHDLPLRSATLRAIITTLVLVGLWPAIHHYALITSWPVVSNEKPSRIWSRILESTGTLNPRSWRGVWLPEWKKELVEVSKWWLVWGAIALFWSIATGTIRCRRLAAPQSDIFARLFSFAPWLIVLEVGLLGAGVFSWKLWFGYVWLKYLNFSMIVHAAIPLFLVGLMFARSVLRARWVAAFAVAVCFVVLCEFVSLFLALFTERNPALL